MQKLDFIPKILYCSRFAIYFATDRFYLYPLTLPHSFIQHRVTLVELYLPYSLNIASWHINIIRITWPGEGWVPSQWVGCAESVSILWRHHDGWEITSHSKLWVLFVRNYTSKRSRMYIISWLCVSCWVYFGDRFRWISDEHGWVITSHRKPWGVITYPCPNQPNFSIYI